MALFFFFEKSCLINRSAISKEKAQYLELQEKTTQNLGIIFVNEKQQWNHLSQLVSESLLFASLIAPTEITRLRRNNMLSWESGDIRLKIDCRRTSWMLQVQSIPFYIHISCKLHFKFNNGCLFKKICFTVAC